MTKQVQEQEEQSKAYQNLMQKRLLRLSGLCLSLWLIVLIKPSVFERQSISSDQSLAWLSLENWQSFTLSRTGDQSVSIFKKMSSTKEVNTINDHIQTQWFVQGRGRVTRTIDPLLQERLIEELGQLKILESRPIHNEVEAKALALSEVALTVSIQDKQGKSLRFRIGAEHLRHSTWVRKLDEQDQAEPTAIRLNGRLRRALDHLSHRWADRRLGLKDDDDLTKVHCFQGRKSNPKHLRRRAWTLQNQQQRQNFQGRPNSPESDVQESNSWFLDFQPKPTLHQSTIKGFIYTLKTLRVSKFVQAKDLINPWRPTHTCLWESTRGQNGWISFGKAQLKAHQKTTSSAHSPLLDLAESQFGLGIIPSHLTHFLVKRPARLFSRKLSFADPSEIIEVSFIPPPSPLLTTISFGKSNWQLSKLATGWYLKSNGNKQLLSEDQQTQFFEQLSRESAQVSYAPRDLSRLLKDYSMKARLNIKLLSSVCQKYELDSCGFELILVKVNSQAKLFSWYRPHDGLLFTISADQQESLIRF